MKGKLKNYIPVFLILISCSFFCSKTVYPRCEETLNLGQAIGECTSLVGVELDILDTKKELEDVTETDLCR